MDEELVDIVDESGKILRQALKTEAHTHGWLHKCVVGYVRDGDKWTLIAQASDKQDAGQYVAPVGGHVMAGESETDALLRESEEEIGTKNITFKPIGQIVFHRQVIGRDENHLFYLYEINTKDTIVLGKESESIKTFTSKELMQALVDTPEKFGDAYYFVLEMFYPEFLPRRYIKRWNTKNPIV